MIIRHDRNERKECVVSKQGEKEIETLEKLGTKKGTRLKREN